MDMMVAMGLVKVLKGNQDLYSKVEKIFESGNVDDEVGKELAEEAKKTGIEIDAEDLLDDLDDLLKNGMNGISVKDMGGLAGIMAMADGLMG